MRPGLPLKKRVIQLKIPEQAVFTPLEKAVRKPYSLTGFTLVELIVVVIIIAIVSAIAVPNYAKAKEKAMGKEALANLKIMAAAERIYKMEQGAYIACSCGSTQQCEDAAAGCNSLLKLDLNPANWAYNARPDGSGGALINAARQGSGGYKDCVYTVDENGDLVSAVSCP